MAKISIPSSQPQAQKSRFQRVQDILRAANGNSQADYQGLNDPTTGKYWWDLGIEDFKQVKIAGLLMIAPPGNIVIVNGQQVQITVPDVADYDKCAPGTPSNGNAGQNSCCTPMEPPKKYPGRGAASNLIKALKGQPPFNAPVGHFPAFMWGGGTVIDNDIQFISDWIDDGCPEYDDNFVPLTDLRAARLVVGEERHMLATRSTNSIQKERNGLKQRKDVECLSEDEVCKWRYVMNEMIQLNQYTMDRRNWNYWGRLHGDECQHGWEQFLLWHRMFLYEFEQRCQDIIPDVTIPYWNWPSERYLSGNLIPAKDINLPKSIKNPVPGAYRSGVVPYPYQCFLNEKGADRLMKMGLNASIKDLVGYRFNSDTTFFWAVEQLTGKLTSQWKKDIRKTLIDINPLWYPFRYPAQFYDKTGNPLGETGMQSIFHHHFPVQQDVDQILRVEQWINFGGGPSYDMSYGVLDMNPHNTVHIWVGGFNPNFDPNNSDTDDYPYLGNFLGTEPQMGDMLNNLVAAYDPIFWPHHSMVDRMFHKWQELYPGQEPFEPDAALSGLSYAARDAASTRALGYEYVMGSYHFETNKTHAFSRLNTAGSGVSGYVLDNHERAEVHLHRVIQPIRSYGIRVFINQPDANVNTPITGNDHFAAYVANFGHGPCIGGPGHCDSPPLNRRLFDQRAMHHNTPRNFKIDVTECVKKLTAKGETDLKVTLVVLDPDANSDQNLLKLEGVSLNFY
ncbi:MAG: tyrosinase family protein [Phycisphaerae bacterium]|nr:tyrosinase family protein [Saprospiraceae bacterium]